MKSSIIFKTNPEDTFTIKDEHVSVNIYNKQFFDITFWNRPLKKYNMLSNFFSEEALDLFYIALFVTYSDKLIMRDSYPDAWTRNFIIYLPVLSIDKWTKEKELLERMLSFLSGDNWKIEFRKRELNEVEQEFKKAIRKSKEDKIQTDNICLLSGGMDSFIGAIDLLCSQKNTIFVSHYGGGPGVHPVQVQVKGALMNEFDLNSNQFFEFNAAYTNCKENTTRTRSILFFSYAICLASTFNNHISIIIPENGLISINVPLTDSRLGSSSTRTTHPFYIKMLQQLVSNLELNVTLNNPYQFMTKGEMIKSCKDTTFLANNIDMTMSCSHPEHSRYAGMSPQHCGTCLPCVIRRSAFKASGIYDKTPYYDSKMSIGDTAKDNLKVYKIAIEKFANNMNHLFSIQQAGPIDKNIADFIGVYERGMLELAELIREL